MCGTSLPGFARDRRIIVFARYPEPGTTKTRLIPTLGPEKSAEMHYALTRHTLQIVSRYAEESDCDVEIRFAGGDLAANRSKFGSKFYYRQQRGDSLGDRLTQAVRDAFDGPASRLVVIGTDCPDLTCELLAQAFKALDDVDIVLGPAADGGYYLVGLRHAQPEVFSGIDWGTDRVLAQTEHAVKRTGNTMRRLPILSDVDFAEDLIQCRRFPQLSGAVLPSIVPGLLTVIIPALNEESSIGETARSALATDGVEVLVVDGGSSDRTVAVAAEAGCRVVVANRGRSRQMNAGAALARGEILLFLHADTRLPDRFAEYVRTCMSGPAIAGAFRLQFDSSNMALRCVAWGANQRSRYCQLPYGDQAIFLRAETFYRIGGYRNWPTFEDYELATCLRKMGNIDLLPVAAISSARRQIKVGIAKSVLLNQMSILAYQLGASPHRIAQWFRSPSIRQRE